MQKFKSRRDDKNTVKSTLQRPAATARAMGTIKREEHNLANRKIFLKQAAQLRDLQEQFTREEEKVKQKYHREMDKVKADMAAQEKATIEKHAQERVALTEESRKMDLDTEAEINTKMQQALIEQKKSCDEKRSELEVGLAERIALLGKSNLTGTDMLNAQHKLTFKFKQDEHCFRLEERRKGQALNLKMEEQRGQTLLDFERRLQDNLSMHLLELQRLEWDKMQRIHKIEETGWEELKEMKKTHMQQLQHTEEEHLRKQIDLDSKELAKNYKESVKKVKKEYKAREKELKKSKEAKSRVKDQQKKLQEECEQKLKKMEARFNQVVTDKKRESEELMKDNHAFGTESFIQSMESERQEMKERHHAEKAELKAKQKLETDQDAVGALNLTKKKIAKFKQAQVSIVEKNTEALIKLLEEFHSAQLKMLDHQNSEEINLFKKLNLPQPEFIHSIMDTRENTIAKHKADMEGIYRSRDEEVARIQNKFAMIEDMLDTKLQAFDIAPPAKVAAAPAAALPQEPPVLPASTPPNPRGGKVRMDQRRSTMAAPSLSSNPSSGPSLPPR